MGFVAKEIDEELMVKLYNEDNLPSTEIAELLGVTSATILLKLHKLGIQVKPKHGNPFNKMRIKDDDIPEIIKKTKYVNGKLTGEVICPICNKSRRLHINRKRINDITNANGMCHVCITKQRRNDVHDNEIINLYEEQYFTPHEIAKYLHINQRKVRATLELYNIMKPKGLLRKLRYDKKLKSHNKGTIENPVVGDIRRSTELGYNHVNYYQYVKCIRCGNTRWESKSKVHKYRICKPCKMTIMGMRKSGSNAPMWLGGLSFEPYGSEFNAQLKEYIKERDDYTCQLCGDTKSVLGIHHIDYDKKNNDETNLISLCTPPRNCHSKTNHNREYWQEFFTKLIKKKYS